MTLERCDQKPSSEYHFASGLKPNESLVLFNSEERASAWDVPVKKRSKTYLKYLLVRLTVCLAFGCLVLSFVGIPLPAGMKKDRSVPFPCQDRACGCMSAADCKHGCCCFSEAQRREWARQRRLDPETVAPAANKLAVEKPHSQASCCGTAGCDCCSATRRSAPEASKKSIETDEDDVVLLWQAKRCQGQGEWWLSIVFVMPPMPTEYIFPYHLKSYADGTPSVHHLVRSDEPDEPVAWL